MMFVRRQDSVSSKLVVVTFKLDIEMLRAIDMLAYKKGLNRSELIRLALARLLKEEQFEDENYESLEVKKVVVY